MNYRHLHLYFERLWGDDILKDRRTSEEKKMDEWRGDMCRRPLEERMYETDEEYIKKELEYYNSIKGGK